MMFPSATTTRLLPALAICLAATLPYVSSAGNYFVNDDFGVVQLLSQKPPLYFPDGSSRPGWTTSGARPRTRFVPSRGHVSTGSRLGSDVALANHVTNIAFHAANALLVLAIARAVAA